MPGRLRSACRGGYSIQGLACGMAEGPYEAMKACASAEETSHSKYMAALIVADLVKKKVLTEQVASQVSAPKKKPTKSKP